MSFFIFFSVSHDKNCTACVKNMGVVVEKNSLKKIKAEDWYYSVLVSREVFK